MQAHHYLKKVEHYYLTNNSQMYVVNGFYVRICNKNYFATTPKIIFSLLTVGRGRRRSPSQSTMVVKNLVDFFISRDRPRPSWMDRDYDAFRARLAMDFSKSRRRQI